MVKLLFQQGGENKFVEISPETHERLRTYSWKIGGSLQQAINLVQEQFSEISEEVLLRYLNGLDQVLPIEMTIGARTYEILSFLRDGEEYLMGSQLAIRVKEMNASVSQDDGEYLLDYQHEIPVELRSEEISFIFTDWQIPQDGVITFVIWNGIRWEKRSSPLGVDWGKEERVLRRRVSTAPVGLIR